MPKLSSVLLWDFWLTNFICNTITSAADFKSQNQTFLPLFHSNLIYLSSYTFYIIWKEYTCVVQNISLNISHITSTNVNYHTNSTWPFAIILTLTSNISSSPHYHPFPCNSLKFSWECPLLLLRMLLSTLKGFLKAQTSQYFVWIVFFLGGSNIF